MKEVAVGIIMKDGHVLACQRKRNAKYALKWEFPGGKLEVGETPEHALVRELREELAIEATVDEGFFRQDWIYHEGTDNPSLTDQPAVSPAGAQARREGSFRVFYFLVKEFSGEPINHAFEQIQWMLPHELQSMDILEGNRDAVERLVKYAEEQLQGSPYGQTA
jgi:8-oxo-dGTP pyrophosphatase MutT (NUDIX family)